MFRLIQIFVYAYSIYYGLRFYLLHFSLPFGERIGEGLLTMFLFYNPYMSVCIPDLCKVTNVR